MDGYPELVRTFPRSDFGSLVVVAPPSGMVVSLNEAKRHLRVDHEEEDSVIRGLISTATDWVEAFLYRQLLTATYRLDLDRFPAGDAFPVELPRPPLQSVSQVQYYDGDGSLQTWSSSLYQVDTGSVPGRLMPVPDGSYPSTQDDRFGAVQVTFTTGYGTAEDVPEQVKAGIKLLLGSLFERREDDIVGAVPMEVPNGVRRILYPLKVADFA